MLYAYIKQLQRQCAQWCYIHLVVSVYSFLILVNWGIPFCPMSFVGNFVFSPVLALFLFLSTMLFFTEICFVPNSYIVWLLELVSTIWIKILKSFSSNALLIPCAQPSSILIATVACGTFIVIMLHSSYLKKNVYLCTMLIGSFLLTHQQNVETRIEQLPCANGTLHIVKTDNKLIIIDPGCLGRYISAPSFVQYTLIPHIIQTYGTNTIDHLILLQPGKLTFDATDTILQKAFIKHLYIPYWQGTLSKSGLRSFMHMKEHAIESGTTIHRLGQHEICLIKNQYTDLSIKPIQHDIKKTSIRFGVFCVGNIIDKQPVTFYPAKYNPKNKTI